MSGCIQIFPMVKISGFPCSKCSPLFKIALHYCHHVQTYRENIVAAFYIVEEWNQYSGHK